MSGFVYAIECAQRIKIGFSEDPQKRFNKVASDAPFPCDLLGYWPGSKSDELDVQDKFKDLRVHGEWFASTEALLAFIGRRSAPVERPASRRFTVRPEDGPLAVWRKSNRLTLEDVSKMVGVTKPTWWRWEAGESKVTVTLLARVEAATGIPRAKLRPDVFGEVA